MAGEAENKGEDVLLVIDVTQDEGDCIQSRQSMVVPRGTKEDETKPRDLINRNEAWHDFRNMFTPIEGHNSIAGHICSRLLLMDCDPQIRKGIEQIRDCLAKSSVGMDNLKKYFNPAESSRFETLDISGLIDEVIACREHVWGIEGTDIVEKDIAPGLKISGNLNHLKQILCNLLNNAFEACCGVPGRKPLIRVTLKQSGPSVRCIIRDNGCGIPVEVKERIGDRDFTTKPDGLGIGFHLSKSRAMEMGGDCLLLNNCDREDLKNEPGIKHGVSAILDLPAVVADQESL